MVAMLGGSMGVMDTQVEEAVEILPQLVLGVGAMVEMVDHGLVQVVVVGLVVVLMFD